MKYLAIDYGTKRVGLAVSREWLAEPLLVVNRAIAIQKLIDVITEERPDALVLGIADGRMVEEARAFAREVVKTLNQPLSIIEVDETLSSVEAQKRMVESGMPRSKRQGAMDHYAAAGFLQDFLDARKER